MNRDVTLHVFHIVGSPFCVAFDDGQKVYERIAVLLAQGQEVTLSFDQVTHLTAVFLNAAVGQLYGNFSEEQIRAGLHVIGLEPDDVALLKGVGERAQLYFEDPQRFEQALREDTGDYDVE